MKKNKSKRADKTNIKALLSRACSRKRTGKNLTAGMIWVIIFCWIIPYLTMTLVLFYSSDKKTERQINETITTSLENAAAITQASLLEAIEESKKASYDMVIKDSYMEFLKTKDETKMYEAISSYLNNTYKYSSVIRSTILMFKKRTEMEYYTYSNVAGSTYGNINEFKSTTKFVIRNVAEKLGTGTQFVIEEGHLYLVRNIVTSDYNPFAILVMEINTDSIFKSMDNVVWYKSGITYIGKKPVIRTTKIDGENEKYLKEYAEENVLKKKIKSQHDVISEYDKENMTAYMVMDVNGQNVSFVAKLDKIGILNEKSTVFYTYIIIIILLIPLLVATIYYFYTNISRPISELMSASEKIEAGNYGYELEKFEKNREFGTLIDTFNHMSVSLEEFFNKIYAEEIAVRDANIKALQSQINPHFLNNTLEIINWKARMSGNDDVSRMIESLGIMMEATMNRKNEPFIKLKEELRYVDAYLYIIETRFGSKFKFSKQIDKTLLNLKIPRLIIQPLVENMVEHGGDEYGKRIGKLIIYEEESYLHIIVENNGNISEKDKLKIKKLLEDITLDDDIPNIGIRNVNLRLRMLYGKQSGLTIHNPENNLTVSEIIIDIKKLKRE